MKLTMLAQVACKYYSVRTTGLKLTLMNDEGYGFLYLCLTLL